MGSHTLFFPDPYFCIDLDPPKFTVEIASIPFTLPAVPLIEPGALARIIYANSPIPLGRRPLRLTRKWYGHKIYAELKRKYREQRHQK